MVLLAFVVAAPLSYYLMDQWLPKLCVSNRDFVVDVGVGASFQWPLPY